MKKTLTIAVLVFWIVGSGWYYTCKIKERCFSGSSPGGVDAEQVTTPSTESGMLLFNWESSEPLTGSGFTAWRDSLVRVVNSGSKIQISGRYSSNEKNQTTEENLGLARAKRLRLLFPMVPDSLISLTSQLDESLNQNIGKPMLASGVEILQAAQASPSPNTSFEVITLYFLSGSVHPILKPDEEKQLENLVSESKKSDRTIEIAGHTDNVGSTEANSAIGLRRAQDLKSFLTKKGIPAQSIKVASMGENQPVGSNETEEGRAKNRRTEIIVK